MRTLSKKMSKSSHNIISGDQDLRREKEKGNWTLLNTFPHGKGMLPDLMN